MKVPDIFSMCLSHTVGVLWGRIADRHVGAPWIPFSGRSYTVAITDSSSRASVGASSGVYSGDRRLDDVPTYLRPRTTRRATAGAASARGAHAARVVKGQYPDDYCYRMSVAELNQFQDYAFKFSGRAQLVLKPTQYVYEWKTGVCAGIYNTTATAPSSRPRQCATTRSSSTASSGAWLSCLRLRVDARRSHQLHPHGWIQPRRLRGRPRAGPPPAPPTKPPAEPATAASTAAQAATVCATTTVSSIAASPPPSPPSRRRQPTDAHRVEGATAAAAAATPTIVGMATEKWSRCRRPSTSGLTRT